jgi:hypothetical protein
MREAMWGKLGGGDHGLLLSACMGTTKVYWLVALVTWSGIVLDRTTSLCGRPLRDPSQMVLSSNCIVAPHIGTLIPLYRFGSLALSVPAGDSGHLSSNSSSLSFGNRAKSREVGGVHEPISCSLGAVCIIVILQLLEIEPGPEQLKKMFVSPSRVLLVLSA